MTATAEADNRICCPIFMSFKKRILRTSLVVQWARFHAFNAGGTSSTILGQEMKTPHSTCCVALRMGWGMPG